LTENAGREKKRTLKITGHEIAGREITGMKMQDMKMQDND